MNSDTFAPNTRAAELTPARLLRDAYRAALGAGDTRTAALRLAACVGWCLRDDLRAGRARAANDAGDLDAA